MGVETISEFEKWSEFIFEQVAEAQVGQGTERGDYRIRRIKMKGLLGESLSRDVLADCPFHVTIQSAEGRSRIALRCWSESREMHGNLKHG